MNSKKSKVLTYVLSGSIPVIIFLIAMIINKTYPFGDKILNIYDSFDQYSSILLTFVRGIKNGNIFYSMNGGLGTNLYANAAYYGTGILNIFSIFANTKNYVTYSTIMILVRFACLGLSMCFYLSKKNLKPVYIIALSISYALMGFTATYYYHFIWIDSIIFLPLVIYGIDKLIDENKPFIYILFLTITIVSNFYIGYMIVLFCILFFIYKILLAKSKQKETIKTFIISSMLVAMISSFILIPAFFALTTGKISVYNQNIKYFYFNKNVFSLLYSLTPASYKRGDHAYGPALIYSSIFVFINVIMFFFNTKYRKKEKVLLFVFIIIFVLSISINFFNYMWHMFARPESFINRFAFLFSFLIIYIASLNLKQLDGIILSNKQKLFIIISVILLLELSSLYKLKFNIDNNVDNKYLIYAIIFSIIAIIYYIIANKKKRLNFVLIIIFLILDIGINTINSVYENSFDSEPITYKEFNLKVKQTEETVKKIKSNDSSFCRTIMNNDDIVNTGLYYDFYNLNYVSSMRNNNTNKFLVATGLSPYTGFSGVSFNDRLDQPILSLYNIKYIINNDSFSYKNNNHPLSLGFTIKKKPNYSLNYKDNYGDNLNKLYSTFSNRKIDFYKTYTYKNFDNKNYTSTISFKTEYNGIMNLENINYILTINEKEFNYGDGLSFNIKKGDNITLSYYYDKTWPKSSIKLTLLDINKYYDVIKNIESNTNELYNIKINKNNHIVSADIDIDSDYNYLFTTIGYEKGMKVYVDGKKIKPDILFDAIIGLELSKGTHTIVIDYVPKGFYTGISISIIGLTLTTFYYVRNKKHFL